MLYARVELIPLRMWMLLILTFVKYMLDSSGRNFWTLMSQFLDVAIIIFQCYDDSALCG